MAEAAVSFLLENLQRLLVERRSLTSGAEKELKQLQNTLELMKAFLEQSANKQEKGELFVVLVKQIREAVYEAEDTLDTCLTKNVMKTKTERFFSLGNLVIAKEVRDILLVLQGLFERAKELLTALPPSDGSGTRAGRSDDNSKKIQIFRKDDVVGFEDEEATLISYLIEETEQLDVIAIVGMPGLGKTTLARKIYHDPNINSKFPTLIWVHVSKKFLVRELFVTIIKKFTDQDMSSKNDQELADLVKSCLEKGRFLIFMDDVWTVEDWKLIEVVLTKGNNLGKVVITSRHARVAAYANRNREPHQLRFMNSDNSWKLLQLEVFGKNNDCPQELEELGMQIASQCGGVPLALVVTGELIRVEKNAFRKDLWEKVSDSVSTYLQNDEQKRTENTISLSYNELPNHLRDCFLYLGMFPEETEIPVWNLICMWIAEGFIQQNGGRSLEEVAEENLNDLVARNLVMVGKTKANGDLKTCRVHNMIRQFCRNEATPANKNLFQELKKTRQGVFDPTISQILKGRRVCIHSNVIEFLRRKPKGNSTVRSIVCFSKESISLPPEYNQSIPEDFELLRVIDVSIKFTKFPELTKLIHLRYIALSVDEFKAIPEAVSKLWNLQTIKIDTTLHEFEMKADISKMTQLRHFKTKAALSIRAPKGKGGENLQTLSTLSAKCCTEELFNRASNLKTLGIRGNLTILVDAECLANLKRLEKLKLVHETSEKSLSRLPQTHIFPPKLRILTLSFTFLDWTEMATLGSLCHLELLKLKEMAFKGRLWRAEDNGFLCLETLHIASTDLETWTAFGNPFPKLKTLILQNCDKLQEIPYLLERTLQLVEIEGVTPTCVQSAQRIEAAKQAQRGQVGAKSGVFKLKIS